MLALFGILPALLGAAEPPGVEFNRDIRPVLSDNCFQCHGPDRARRKADLRLDTEAGAFADLGGRRALVPGKPEESELYRRITAATETERMPPAKSGPRLNERQIDLIRRWIAQGVKWQKHWSLIPPQRPPLPSVKNHAWPRNPIDHFILARLEREGLAPSPEADKATLIRRVTLDLTGLPPTPQEVDAFLADTSPDAYEKLVERLLASPRYGERMAIRWLDAARYADTNGYQSDGERFMWRWRDWVIDAFNRNLPFDQFTVEQLAGDLLPGATLEQRIATGFNRNHRGNAEGGIIPEEYAVEYVVDRVDTTATVWLGLTMGCARCHDHKYDPITQKEFYQVFAYFNNVPERGKAVKFGNSPPVIRAPTREQQEELKALEARLAAAAECFRKMQPELDAAQAQWERTPLPDILIDWTVHRALLAHYRLDGDTVASGRRQLPAAQFKDGSPVYVEGRIGQAAEFDGKRYIDAGNVGDFGFYDKFSLAAWIYPQGDKGGAILSRRVEESRVEGYGLALEAGKLHAYLVKRWLDDALRVETERRLEPGRWHHVLVTYDGSRTAAGIRVYVNGRPEKLKVNLDDLNQSFKVKAPLRIGAAAGGEERFHGLIDDVRVYDDALSPQEAELVATFEAITDILTIPAEKRSKAQAAKLRAYFLEWHAPEPVRRAHRDWVNLGRQCERLIESFPTTMVMEEMPTPRKTFVLIRGEYDKPGEPVTPGVPASLGTLPAELPNNRLGFAKWLVQPPNPLTARVAVNRWWQTYFGTGLVRTPEDFGSQGEWPSHPELLDWLATELVRTGWDVKAMQRRIVTSAAYRQSSKVTPELRQRDPENRLLARGPRFRLSAEVIRDQALFASGLLVEKLGGPSVRPYQPAGLSRELGAEAYVQDHGPSLYRRSLYTFWKRTVTPPAMTAFDAPGRESCTVRETRTNTPLQALNLMNDVTYVEAARVLAERIMKEAATPEQRLTLAFRLLTAHPPKPAEMRVLLGSLERYRERYGKDAEAARKLVSVGESSRDERLDVGELAAYTAVASMLLNLDEVITKE
jgi:mono/diheme cytochrome c family protein